MADRDMALDCRGGPWPLVPVLTCCPKCGGALPPDDVEACSTCGIGTPRGLPPVPLLVDGFEETITPLAFDIPATAAVDTSALDDGGALWALIAELSVPLPPAPPEPPAPKLTWWERFARWPHG